MSRGICHRLDQIPEFVRLWKRTTPRFVQRGKIRPRTTAPFGPDEALFRPIHAQPTLLSVQRRTKRHLAQQKNAGQNFHSDLR